MSMVARTVVRLAVALLAVAATEGSAQADGLHNRSPPTFGRPALIPLGNCSDVRCGAGAPRFADANGDGVQDMIAPAADGSSSDIAVLLGDGDGGFAEHARPRSAWNRSAA
jgi:hypothetical protein